jgi:hypothetical protein
MRGIHARPARLRASDVKTCALLLAALLVACSPPSQPSSSGTAATRAPTQAATVAVPAAAPSVPGAAASAGNMAPAAPATVNVSVPAASPQPAQESRLRRRDAPPRDVSVQLSNFGGGASGGPPDCDFDLVGTQQKPVGSPCTAWFLSDVDLNFRSSPADRSPIQAQVTGPDGASKREVIQPGSDGVGRWVWSTAPGDSVGTYTVAATQGTRRVAGSFEVKPTPAPAIHVRSRRDSPGTTVEILLAGYPPRQTVRLRLYRLIRGLSTFWYFADLPDVPVDDRGQATSTLTIQPGDPEGAYAVLTEPPFQYGLEVHTFWIGQADWPTEAEGNTALALAVLEEAHRMRSSVLGKDRAPYDVLDCRYGEQARTQLIATADDLRARGQYREARLTAPIVIRDVRPIPGDSDRLEVAAAVRLDDRLYSGDGALLQTLSSRIEQRYVLRFEPHGYAEGCWVVAETAESTPTPSQVVPPTAMSIPTPTAPLAATNSPATGWVVQVGAFANRSTAEQTVAEARSRGFSPASFDLGASLVTNPASPENLFVVYVGPFGSRTEAEARLAAVRSGGYPSAFLREIVGRR